MTEEILLDGEEKKREHSDKHYTNVNSLFHAFSYDVVVQFLNGLSLPIVQKTLYYRFGRLIARSFVLGEIINLWIVHSVIVLDSV